jgi:hypothetical protein
LILEFGYKAPHRQSAYEPLVPSPFPSNELLPEIAEDWQNRKITADGYYQQWMVKPGEELKLQRGSQQALKRVHGNIIILLQKRLPRFLLI